MLYLLSSFLKKDTHPLWVTWKWWVRFSVALRWLQSIWHIQGHQSRWKYITEGQSLNIHSQNQILFSLFDFKKKKKRISLSKKRPIQIIHINICFWGNKMYKKYCKQINKKLVFMPENLSLKLHPNNCCICIHVVLWAWALWLGLMPIREKQCFLKM